MSSASSTARWMDWTVDSMSTTTLLQAPGRMGTDADHLDRAVITELSDDRHDFRRADVEADDHLSG